MNTQLSLLDSVWCENSGVIVLEKMRGRVFTTDDVHPLLTVPENKNLFGIMMAKLRNTGKVRRVGGYIQSKRPEANGRPVAQWEVV